MILLLCPYVNIVMLMNVFLWQEVIPTFDMAVNELFFERFPDSILEFQIQVRPYNALKTRNMRSLNPEGVWIYDPGPCHLQSEITLMETAVYNIFYPIFSVGFL